MGVMHKADPSWATHIPVLLKALELTDGPVLELGMGMMSTPLLHIMCEAQNRSLISYDNDGRFIEMFSRFVAPWHVISLIEDWSTLNLYQPWTVALVDQKPAVARKDAIKQLTHVDYVVVHDTQERADEFYGFEEIYPLFKYRYDYTKFSNQTTVLSNKHDVQNFLHNPINK